MLETSYGHTYPETIEELRSLVDKAESILMCVNLDETSGYFEVTKASFLKHIDVWTAPYEFSGEPLVSHVEELGMSACLREDGILHVET